MKSHKSIQQLWPIIFTRLYMHVVNIFSIMCGLAKQDQNYRIFLNKSLGIYCLTEAKLQKIKLKKCQNPD